MSLFLEYKEKLNNAINTCLDVATQYRINNNAPEAPQKLVQELVHQHIAPLAGKENVLNIVIVQREKERSDWRRPGIEAIFRRVLLKLVNLEETDERYNRVFDCLDFILNCGEVDLLDTTFHLNAIEEILDLHSINGCERIFKYIEKRKNRITLGLEPNKGKGLVLLRLCNELLRRLSKETTTVFCGRILMFLANSFPLDERSGVNLRGDFNTDMVQYDSDEVVDADPSLTEDQKTFYKIFWSTRVYFSNPPSIFAQDNFTKLQQGTDIIVQRLQVIGEKEAELAGARKTDNGHKRKQTDIDIDVSRMEEDPALTERMLAEINRDYQFPRLLSSRRLLGLEMEDARFRRNLIVQFLILFQYLLGFTEEEKDRTAKLIEARPNAKPSLVPPTYTLKSEQAEWIHQVQETILTLLRATKPHGNLYTDIILNMLVYERHWIIWKASGCPKFEKPPMSMKDLEKSWLNKKPRLEAQPAKYRYSHGSYEVSKLYGKPIVPLADFMRNRAPLPTAIEIIDKSIAELDDSLESSKERFDFANGALLQSVRLMYQKHPLLIRNVYNRKKEVYKEMHEKRHEAKENDTMADDSKPATPAPDFIVGEEVDEDYVESEKKVLMMARELITNELSQSNRSSEEPKRE
ncbi:THO complex subunit 1 transcription elongation factor-domain-containing protein [Choanephora cucurbitarum]|nr:THO complex subunit 1 transcription elongation factor-domain-containing protein [Choanephora cucurbitarum]